MPVFTQKNRSVAIGTPLGDDVLLLKSMNGTEQLGRLFQFNLQLVSEKPDISFEDLLGRNVTVRLNLPDTSVRYFNGIISRFSQIGSNTGMASYSATMVPWFWLLTRVADCRIFQNQNIPDIIKKVFSDYGFSDIKDSLSGDYPKWEYCVQYRETCFNFISRLMEQTGIYYYFEHENGKHTLVLADGTSAHVECPGYGEVKFRPEGEHDTISDWVCEKQVLSGAFAHRDFNFEKPKTALQSAGSHSHGHAMADFEIFDYPGEFQDSGVGDKYASIRMEELQVGYEVFRGVGTAMGLLPGGKFKLADHPIPTNNIEYLVTYIQHQIVSDEFGAGGGGSAPLYQAAIRTINAETGFRSQRSTPKPQIAGPQTAMITGPKGGGEEIHTDEHGRVKVQFHWDRDGKYDENSSCWVRVSQNWAGKKWGAFFLPRIGQEVIVEFLEGDPDRPIITGRVYNGDAKPPYDLPADKTKSTLKSNSSTGGEGFNELRFEDKKDAEQIFLHAEKDMDVRVLNDYKAAVEGNVDVRIGEGKKGEADVGNRTTWIQLNDQLLIKGDRIEKVEGDHSETTLGDNFQKTEGSQNLTVVGDSKTKVDGGAHLTVAGDQNTEITGNISRKSKGKIQEKAAMDYAMDAGMNVHIKAGMNLILEAGLKLSLKVGGSFVDIGPAGVFISGPMVMINSGGAAGAGGGSSPVAPEAPDDPEEPVEAKKAELGSAGEISEVSTETLVERKAVKLDSVKVADMDAQASVLVAAAEDGTPFCEECERARQEQAQAENAE